MSEFKNKAQSIIEGYCEGISYLEFNVNDLPEMLDKIESEAFANLSVILLAFCKENHQKFNFKRAEEAQPLINDFLKTIKL